VVGSDLGGIPELVDQCGRVFTPGDSSELARTVVAFFRLPMAERDRIAEAARRRSQSHQREAHVVTIESLYGELPPKGSVRKEVHNLFSADCLAALQQASVERTRVDERNSLLPALRAMARTLGLPKLLG
jgi:hypothetical protein